MNYENEFDKEDFKVIPDECGDTLWDAVLQQDIKSCEPGNGPGSDILLPHTIETKLAINKTIPAKN